MVQRVVLVDVGFRACIPFGSSRTVHLYYVVGVILSFTF